MKGQNRKDIRPEQTVDIVLKQDQRSGKLTRGMIKEILTNSAHHPHGSKFACRTSKSTEFRDYRLLLILRGFCTIRCPCEQPTSAHSPPPGQIKEAVLKDLTS